MSAQRRPALSRRRFSGAGPRLGAVKLQSPLCSDAGSPTSGSEAHSALATPQELSPLVARPAAPADSGHVPAASVAQFSRQLAASRSADRWLDEQSAASGGGKGALCQQQLRRGASQQQQSPAVESAASQIVHKALRFITTDTAKTPEAALQAASGRTPASAADAQTFLDKGMDAINSVGRLMEGFALTLDNVIGEAFADWGASGPSGPNRPSGASRPAMGPRAPPAAAKQSAADGAGKENVARHAAGAAGAAAKPHAQQQQQAQQPQAGSGVGSAAARQAHITSFMSKLDAVSEQEAAEWRKRAQQLAGELQRMRTQQEEYQRLRLQYDKLQSDLQHTSSQAEQLAEENCALKSRSLPPEVDPSLSDPLAARQVALQMEALLVEKSKLAAENDRLLRENTGLQELLEFTLAHQSQLAADGELFGCGFEEGEDGEPGCAAAEAAVLAAAAGGGSPPAMEAPGADTPAAASTST